MICFHYISSSWEGSLESKQMFFKRLIFGFSMRLLSNGSSLKYSVTPGWDLTFSLTAIIILYITKMFNLDDITNENNKEHNEKYPYTPDHPYRILIIGGSESGKTNSLFNLIKTDDINKIYLHAKNLMNPSMNF